MRLLMSAVVAGLMLSGAAEAQTRGAGPGTPCSASAASFALGERYSDRLARRARRAAGAEIVRKTEPGRAYTMEFRGDRLNLDLDRKGRVRAIRCG